MEIKTIKIKNFKSIGDAGYKACVNNCNLQDDKCIEPKENCIIEDWGLVLECNPDINAFIGQNGSGKSSVFEAINFVLGERDPSKPYSITIKHRDGDNYNFYYDNRIELIKSNENYCKICIIYTDNISVTCKIEKDIENNQIPDYFNLKKSIGGHDIRSISHIDRYFALHDKEQIYPNFIPKIICTLDIEKDRNFYKCSFINGDRAIIYDGIGDTNNNIESFIGSKFPYVKLDTLEDTLLFKNEIHLCGLHDFGVFTNGESIPFPLESSGRMVDFILSRGIQKYPENPCFIDEPELYLHPQKKKELHNYLDSISKSIADGGQGRQIFYITHSAEFLSYEKPEQIFLFKNDKTINYQTKVITKPKEVKTKDHIEYLKCENIDINSGFFADSIIIVEGKGDKILFSKIIEYFSGQIPEHFGITILESTGENNIKHLYALYKIFKIKMLLVKDLDIENKNPNYPKDELNIIFNSDQNKFKQKYRVKPNSYNTKFQKNNTKFQKNIIKQDKYDFEHIFIPTMPDGLMLFERDIEGYFGYEKNTKQKQKFLKDVISNSKFIEDNKRKCNKIYEAMMAWMPKLLSSYKNP